MKHRSTVLPLALAISALACASHAQNPSPTDIRACTGIETDALRLACYDKATGRVNLPAAQKHETAADVPAGPSQAGVFRPERRVEAVSASKNESVDKPLSLLDSRWELSPESKLGTFNLRGFKPVYVMPVFATSNQNRLPKSLNPVNTVTTPQPLDNVETKFQLSLKTKVWQGVFGDVGDLWVGYTQDSHWQLYNQKDSRPFRETDYEPEAMLVFATNYHIFGWNGRLLSLDLIHQSNGRADPLSRSWNRVASDIAFDRPGWTVTFRPWWRIPESAADDNNPDISDYMGRGEVQIVHEWKGQEFSLLLRDSLRGGSRQHGAGKLTWSFPIAGNLRGYTEFFKGYGESLIDYNHNATYLGVGISLLDWY